MFSISITSLYAIIPRILLATFRARWPNRYCARLPSSMPCRVKPVTYKFDTCLCLAGRSALIDWLEPYTDNLTVGYQVMVPEACNPVGQQYKVVINVHCHKSVPILICSKMLLGHKTTSKQSYWRPVVVGSVDMKE